MHNQLTKREVQVLAPLIAAGKSSKEVGAALGVAWKTVGITYLTSRCLNVND